MWQQRRSVESFRTYWCRQMPGWNARSACQRKEVWWVCCVYVILNVKENSVWVSYVILLLQPANQHYDLLTCQLSVVTYINAFSPEDAYFCHFEIWTPAVLTAVSVCVYVYLCVSLYVCVDFTCEPGEFLDINSDQECHSCPAGTFSLGGGVLFKAWKELPTGFSTSLYSFASSRNGHTESNTHNSCSG